MERIRWSEKLLSLRTVVDNSAVTKPTLVQIGNRFAVMGEKLNGEFLLVSPHEKKDGRADVSDRTILLTSKNPGIWKIISKTTGKREGFIHRLTTKDLESIHKQDVRNARSTPRTYICLKEIEAFELFIRANDPYIANGHRVERIPRRIPENVEFNITDVGEAEYTPTEGEITSQDYVKAPNARSTKILNALVPGVGGPERLIRNRILRTIYCTTKNETHKRHFLLEVNEQACDIRPIASDGSSELRYLQSTKNLYDYLMVYGNETTLEVKLMRGDPPVKATNCDGRMTIHGTLSGDRIPLCQIETFEMTLATPDLPIRVRLPSAAETGWRSLSDIRNAELQCMQLSLALLSRHESEVFVQIESDKIGSHNFQQSYQDENENEKEKEKERNSIRNNSKVKSTTNPTRSLQSRPSLNVENRQLVKTTTMNHHGSPRTSRAMPLSHPASDRLYQDEERRGSQSNRKVEQTRTDFNEKLTFSTRPTIREKPATTTKFHSNSIAK